MKKDEQEWLSRVADLGCIVCRREGYGLDEEPARAEIHHIRHMADGGGIKARDNYHCLPLCPIHHRLGDHSVALHAGQRAWEKRYGAENVLYLEVLDLMGESNEKNI